MVEKLPDIWIATDINGHESWLFETEPKLIGSSFYSSNARCVKMKSVIVPHGWKAKYTLLEAHDFRPKPKPELWVTRTPDGYTLRSVIGDHIRTLCVMPNCGDISLEPFTPCRIAWDENGIRLIGEPVAL